MASRSPRSRIFLHPGEVRSSSDGQWHYIDAPTLARLYGANLADCIVHDYRREETSRGHRAQPRDVHLYPRQDGNYQL